MTKMFIVVRFHFEAIHSWPNATPPTEYLKYPHRHLFYVQARREVQHDERQIEIIDFKKKLKHYCSSVFGGEPTNCSCETMARMILTEFDLDSCRVLEDGENGAEVVLE